MTFALKAKLSLTKPRNDSKLHSETLLRCALNHGLCLQENKLGSHF